MTFKSAIYHGELEHCRLKPTRHQFRYRVAMLYLDLDEVEEIFALSSLWSAHRFALAWLRRKDFLVSDERAVSGCDIAGSTEAGNRAAEGAGAQIKAAVIARIHAATGENFSGRVRMLANLRYFGFQMNPLVCYYCFDAQERLQYIVAEVTNTPWREKHAYVLRCNPENKTQRISFGKALHVSPFNGMDMMYHWRSDLPGKNLRLILENRIGDEKVFDATLALQHEAISAQGLTRFILSYPFMTLKVCGAIYWQALRLWLKGVRIVPHPGADKKNSINYAGTHEHDHRN